MGEKHLANIMWEYDNWIPWQLRQINLQDIHNKKQKSLLDTWKSGINTHNTQTIQQKLQNVQELPNIWCSVPEWFMDRLKEALNSYVEGQWVVSIMLIGALAEYFSFWKIEDYIKEKGIGGVLKHSTKGGIYNQDERIRLLRNLRIIDDKKFTCLNKIRETRNKYVHLKTLEDKHDAKLDALASIKLLIQIINKRNKPPKSITVTI